MQAPSSQGAAGGRQQRRGQRGLVSAGGVGLCHWVLRSAGGLDISARIAAGAFAVLCMRTCPASSVKAALPCPVIPTQKAPVGLRGALPSFRAAQCCVQCLPHALLAHRALVALHACPQSSGCCPCWPTELWLLSMLAAASDFSVPCTQTSSSGLPLPDNDALLLSGALVEHLAPYLVLPFFAQGVLLDVLLELNGARTPHSPAATLAAMRLLYCE